VRCEDLNGVRERIVFVRRRGIVVIVVAGIGAGAFAGGSPEARRGHLVGASGDQG
jgi:hypothetical protein